MTEEKISLDDHQGIRDSYRRRHGCLPSIVLPNLSVEELWDKLETHRAFEYWGALLQLVAAHPQVDQELLAKIADSETDHSVLSAVAVSKRASRETLERLSKSSSSTMVRGHAVIGLIHRDIGAMSFAEVRALFSRFRGDDDISLGVKHLLASRVDTPCDVLAELANDESDFVRIAAESTLIEQRERNFR